MSALAPTLYEGNGQSGAYDAGTSPRDRHGGCVPAHLSGAARRVKARIVAEDLRLQRAQRRTGLQTQLV